MQTLTCAGNSGCTRAVAMIGSEGYAYCDPCGIARRMTSFERVRKLTPTERRRLEASETISYQRQSNPKARAVIDPETLRAIRTALAFLKQDESLRAAFQLRQALAQAGESE
jgi:hypothetical protein